MRRYPLATGGLLAISGNYLRERPPQALGEGARTDIKRTQREACLDHAQPGKPLDHSHGDQGRTDAGGLAGGYLPIPRPVGHGPHHTWERGGKVSGRAESNCRPPGPKPGALPLGHAPVAGRFGIEAMGRGTEDPFRDWPHSLSVGGREVRQLIQLKLVPPGRLELPFLAPEASALSAELRGPPPK